MMTSEESICCQDQKEVLEECFDKAQQSEGTGKTLQRYSDRSDIRAMLLQHHNAVTSSEAVMNS